MTDARIGDEIDLVVDLLVLVGAGLITAVEAPDGIKFQATPLGETWAALTVTDPEQMTPAKYDAWCADAYADMLRDEGDGGKWDATSARILGGDDKTQLDDTWRFWGF